MGIYLNPSNVLFQRDLNGDIYVDKSMLIEKLNNIIDKPDNYLCVSRPRRFGKTMMTNLITAYYSKGCDSRELFSKLKIAQTPDWDKNLNKFNVIKLNLVRPFAAIENKEDLPKEISRRVNEELIEEFPKAKIKLEDDLGDSLIKVYSHTGERFILIMDEYDLMIREKVSQKAFHNYLEFLNGMFKSPEVSCTLHMAYLTGILPIVRDKIQSKLNEFKEYSMINPRNFSDYFGYTEDEVKSLCDKHNIDFAECKRWYCGYKIGNTNCIYNPISINETINRQKFDYYWNRTGSYKSIEEFISMDFDGIYYDVVSLLGGSSVKVNVGLYLNTVTGFTTKDEVFAYFIHIGYLAYDTDKKVCWIPNNEIRQEWMNAITAIS